MSTATSDVLASRVTTRGRLTRIVERTRCRLHSFYLDRSHYDFRDVWQIDATLDEVAAALFDSESLTSWWLPFRHVATTQPGTSDGRGRVFRSEVRGFLPYRLDLHFHVVKADFPTHFEVELDGDFRGTGSGRLLPHRAGVRFETTLNIRLERRSLRMASLVARRLLVAHHRWTMTQGQWGLNRELRRRRVG